MRYRLALVAFAVLVVVLGSGSLTPSSRVLAAKPAAQRLVYQTNWKRGLVGWRRNGTGHIKALNNMLYYDGKGTMTLMAPLSTGRLTNYAVEVEAQFPELSATYYNSYFALLFRGGSCNGNDAGDGDYGSLGCLAAGLTWPCDNCTDASAFVSEGGASGFTPDQDWHTYRLQVRGIHTTLTIDGAIVATGESNSYLFGNGAGLFIQSSPVIIRVFKVFALR